MFVGAISDNFDERIEQKIFHAEIVVDNDMVKRETSNYEPIPEIINFRDTYGNDIMKEQIQLNYDRIKQDIRDIVSSEMERIENDPELAHLIKEK